MKKLIFVSSLVFALLLMFACNEEQGVEKVVDKEVGNPHYSNPPLTLLDTINLIGLQHNECQDTLFARFERIKSGEDNVPNMSWQAYAKLVSYQFAEDKGWEVQYVDTSDINLDEAFLDTLSINNLIIEDTTLTSEAKILLFKLDTALNRYCIDEDLSVLINTCDSIISSAVNNLSEVEAIKVGCGASIAKNSALYWSDNNNWQRMIDLGEPFDFNIFKKKDLYPIMLMNNSQREILKTDARHAIKGAIRGAIWGLSVGGGWGALAGAISGALIRGSVASFARGVYEALKK